MHLMHSVLHALMHSRIRKPIWIWERNELIDDFDAGNQKGRFDASDAGMSYYVASGGAFFSSDLFQGLLASEGLPAGCENGTNTDADSANRK
jgi:hypothetical protein